MELCDPKGEFAMCVRVDGQKLQVHRVQHFQVDPLGPRSECWVVSEPESSYQPEIDGHTYLTAAGFNKKHPDLTAQLTIDGKTTERFSMRRRKDSHPLVFSGPLINVTETRPYVFSKPILLEEEPSMQESEASKLGSITISLYRVKFGDESRVMCTSLPTLCESLSEKEKKATLSLVTKLGPAVPAGRVRGVRTESTLDKDRPYYKFTFRYGTKAQLQAMGIVPPDPVVVGAEGQAPNESEMAESEALREAKEEALMGIRRAEGDLARAQEALARASGGVDMQRRKRKASSDDRKPDIKKVKVENGSLFDLTQDSDGGPIDLTLDD